MKHNIVLVGHGYWGKNIARNLDQLGCLYGVCDPSADRRQAVAELYPKAQLYDSFESVVADEDVEAVAISSPAETHARLAISAMEAGKDAFVEKPLALTYADGRGVVTSAATHGRILMVGHLLEYHGAVIELVKLVRAGALGKLQYIYSNRLNLGKFRSEENILWSFAPHDIAIIQYLVGSNPISVDAKGATFLQNEIEDTTITHLSYPGNVHAHIFVSWLHPFKEQRLVVIGHKGMLVFEDTSPKDKLRFYPKGFDDVDGELKKFDGDHLPIPYTPDEPLAAEHRHFYECVQKHQTPLTDGIHALDVLRILEEAQNKLKDGSITS